MSHFFQSDAAMSALLGQLTVILAATKCVGALFRRLGQPQVCGEIAAGFILGPSLFGRFVPNAFHSVFDSATGPALSMFSQVRLDLLLFFIGQQVSLTHVRSCGLTENGTTELIGADVDVVILGAGLAGLSLTRQLILNSSERILLLEKRSHVPPLRQKVGEATVQLSGYYCSKVLDLEEHLLRKHFMKYNLGFYWKARGQPNDSYEHHSQPYIRNMSNVPTYRLDRNKLEAELLRLDQQSPTSHFTQGCQ
jgi:hypothetical protein